MIQSYFENIICARLEDWHKKNLTTFEYNPSFAEGTLAYYLEKVCYHNYQGWHYEDLGQLSDPEKVIQGWRGSQKNNRHRNQTVQMMDALFAGYYQESAAFHTESLGVILDKVTILYLKYLHFVEQSTEKSAPLLQTIHALIACTQTLYNEILAGKKRCITFPHVKLYDAKAL